MIGMGAAILGSAAIQAGAGYLSGKAGADAASDAQAAAQRRLDSGLDFAKAKFRPFRTAGLAALDDLNALFLSPDGTDISPFLETPGYQFIQDQGLDAINRAQAAGGRLVSGETLEAASQFNQGLASTQFDNYVNRLMSLAGMGFDATSNITGAALGASSAGANLAYGTGLAGGAARQGMYDAFGNAANGAIGNAIFADYLGGGNFFGGGAGTSSYGVNSTMPGVANGVNPLLGSYSFGA